MKEVCDGRSAKSTAACGSSSRTYLDLAIVYANTDAWDQDVAQLESKLPNITALQGTLGQGASVLLQALTLRDEITKLLHQLYSYASLSKDSDSTDPSGQALEERAGSLYARISAALAFI